MTGEEGEDEEINTTAGTGFFNQFPMFPKQIISLHLKNKRNWLKKPVPAKVKKIKIKFRETK